MLQISDPDPASLRPLLRAADLPDPARLAWFFDLDGTLIDLAPRPDAVTCPPGLSALLDRLRDRSEGALAIITGRQRRFAEDLLGVEGLTILGLHGAERPGLIPHRPSDIVAGRLRRFAEDTPGVIFEDKGAALALHYRLAPAAKPRVEALMREGLVQSGAGFQLRPGHMVVELCPATAGKGKALARLMREPPFAGRIPFAAGDDLTDEAMFSEVNPRGGLSLRIGSAGPDCLASFGLPGPAAFRSLLQQVAG
ncbi:trehalose-phosphatase [Falsigemmobacter faecalis]|nr:trehalose-phosphatase [Falsigemmobacter faecalis]